jgi:hypothetical protein
MEYVICDIGSYLKNLVYSVSSYRFLHQKKISWVTLLYKRNTIYFSFKGLWQRFITNYKIILLCCQTYLKLYIILEAGFVSDMGKDPV